MHMSFVWKVIGIQKWDVYSKWEQKLAQSTFSKSILTKLNVLIMVTPQKIVRCLRWVFIIEFRPLQLNPNFTCIYLKVSS